MSNELVFIFKADEMRKLLDGNPDLVVVRSRIEAGVLKEGQKVGYVKVWADGVWKDKPGATMQINGCPEPPCTPNGDSRY